MQPQPVAVLDTNVLIDVYSCHDYAKAFDKAHAVHGEAAAWQPDVAFRGRRARAALLLLMHLHEQEATTWGNHGEMLRKLLELVPPAPEQPGGRNFELDYTSQFIWFVRDHVLSGWNHTVPGEAEDPRGNAADQWLVDEAARLKVPLVSNEGLRADDTINLGKEVHVMAGRAGVQVLTPRAFFANKLDEERAIAAFFQRFDEQARREVAGRTDQLHAFFVYLRQYFVNLLS